MTVATSIGKVTGDDYAGAPEVIFKVWTRFFDEILAGEKPHEWRGWTKWNSRLDGPGFVGPVIAVFLDDDNLQRPPHRRVINGWEVVSWKEAPVIVRQIYPDDGSFYRIELGEVLG